MEEKVEAIKASDLLKLMDVVQAAVSLYNELERGSVDLTGATNTRHWAMRSRLWG